MKIFLVSLIVSFPLLCFGKNLSKKIIGKWQREYVYENKTQIDYFEFFFDGTGKRGRYLKDFGQQHVSAIRHNLLSWKIKGDTLSFVYQTLSNQNGFIGGNKWLICGINKKFLDLKDLAVLSIMTEKERELYLKRGPTRFSRIK